MVCGGIIAEYNPFHNGHAWQIEEFRKTGVDVVAVCLSGNYTQRGEPSFLDKFRRAEMAVKGGADLVLELPVPYAMGSAERFAAGAVSILSRIGITSLCFGTEEGELEILQNLSTFFNSAEFLGDLQDLHATGMSFPRAREEVVLKKYPKWASFLKGSNNILAIEYLRALERQNSQITPVTFPRQGADHGGLGVGVYGSASFIRESLRKEENGAFVLMPENNVKEIKKWIGMGLIPDEKRWEVAVLSTLKRMNAEELSKIVDCGEGLEYRIETAAQESVDMEMLYEKIKSKRYTMSRITRVVMSAFLGITPELSAARPPYLRILAMNEQGQKWLKQHKENGGEEVFTRFGQLTKDLPTAKPWTQLEIKADDQYTFLLKSPAPSSSDFFHSVRPIQKI